MVNNFGSELDVNDWINSAQDDLITVLLVSQVPVITTVCYHCGQAVEKILKAYIIAKENVLTKTHDLIPLIKKSVQHSQDFGRFEDICIDISTFSTIRYPPKKNLTKQEMRQTIKGTLEIVDFTMEKLKQLGYNLARQPESEEIKKIIETIEAYRRVSGTEELSKKN